MMMKNFLLLMIVFLSPSAVPGCEELMKQIPASSSNSLTQQEIVDGLKTALLVGTDSSVSYTSRLNGFYKDEAIKILLPPEASIIYENKNNALFRATGIDRKIEDAIIALNRAAEDASKEAGPIFIRSIKNLSISDGFSILKGKNPALSAQEAGFDSTAATSYLKSTTKTELTEAFSPVIQVSLDKTLVGNLSPNQIWHSLITSYNSIANNSFGMIEPVKTTNLGTYVTDRALDGIFYKVAEEEIKIRQDPFKWAKSSVGAILQKVFGSQNV